MAVTLTMFSWNIICNYSNPCLIFSFVGFNILHYKLEFLVNNYWNLPRAGMISPRSIKKTWLNIWLIDWGILVEKKNRKNAGVQNICLIIFDEFMKCMHLIFLSCISYVYSMFSNTVNFPGFGLFKTINTNLIWKCSDSTLSKSFVGNCINLVISHKSYSNLIQKFNGH